ncbi:hypothetical protein IT881_15055 [Erythrobacter sp. A30-3]|nr:hypothetical protein IT881_15055 [Erythrobacter sp. A30-3]
MGTRAEQLRHHRKCFEYALTRGITPREADLEMKLQAARERHQALVRKMTAKNRETCIAPAPIAASDDMKPRYWWEEN